MIWGEKQINTYFGSVLCSLFYLPAGHLLERGKVNFSLTLCFILPFSECIYEDHEVFNGILGTGAAEIG